MRGEHPASEMREVSASNMPSLGTEYTSTSLSNYMQKRKIMIKPNCLLHGNGKFDVPQAIVAIDRTEELRSSVSHT